MARGVHAVRWPLLAILAVALIAFPAVAAPKDPPVGGKALAHVSQAVAIRYWFNHPDQAPGQVGEALRSVAKAGKEKGPKNDTPSAVAALFNSDTTGLPQNEESITVCRSNPRVVLGGTNDYRGLLDPEGNFTGWHLSTDGGATLAKDGLLPSIAITGAPAPVPSGGDPVMFASGGCALYAADLNYDPFDPFHNPNGVGVYKTTPETLAACLGGPDPSCWPTRRAAAETRSGHFLDKPWFYVGRSGSAGTVVWVTYSDFVIDDNAPLGYTSASIKAVRCAADLKTCTQPILISGSDQDVQFSDVTIGADGRVYVTWSEIQGELPGNNGHPGQPQTFIHKLRIAAAGSTTFGPTRLIATENLAIPFDGHLHAEDFRVATYAKNEVAMVDDNPRIFLVWDACQFRPLDFICEEPAIKLVYSDDDGAHWNGPRVLSSGGDNYFPTIDADPKSEMLAIAWYTTRFDPTFHNRQDVEFVTVDSVTLSSGGGRRLTTTSNENEADPLLGGRFIGDYFEVTADNGTAWVHYNANHRPVRFLSDGIPVPQQDNFLIKVRYD